MYDTPPSLPVKRRIKRIAPLQLGKMLALLYGLMGVLIVPLFILMSLVATPGASQPGMLGMGAGFMLLMPVMYAAMGFIGGLLGAVIYNLIAKWIGGIEVEVE